MTQFIDTLVGIFQSSGFAQFGQPGGWLYAVMICVGYTVLLCFTLFKTGSLAKSVFQAH